MRACAAKRKSSMMKEQTRLELNISSLIWENWTKRDPPRSQYDIRSTPPPPAGPPLAHLFLDVSVLEDQGERGDVLPVHALAAPDLDGVFDALVDLLGGGLPNVGQRTVCEGGQDLQRDFP